jgi:hypothetical protein
MGGIEDVYIILIGNPEGNRPLERSGHRYEGNTKVYIEEIFYDDVDWIHLAQDRIQRQAFVSTVTNFLFMKCRQFIDQMSDY